MDRGLAPRPLDAMLQDLKSRSDDVRGRASTDLQQFLVVSSRSLNGDAFGKVYTEVTNRLFFLANSPDLTDKMGAIQTIEKILDIIGSDMSRAIHMSTYVQKALPCADPAVMTLASKVFARLATGGGTVMFDHVEKQVKRTIEWLQGERREERRYAAALVLRELAKTAPQTMSDLIPDLLDNLWTALRDPKVAIREAAAGALSGCLAILSSKDSATRSELYAMVYEQAQRGFKLGTPDAIHGSLLGYKELVIQGGTFMRSRFQEAFEEIMNYKDHREPLIRRAVVELMPTFATFNVHEFMEYYLHRCMVHLIEQLRKDRDKSTAFHAIGHVALAVRHQMAPYLDAVLASLKEALGNKNRKGAPNEASIFGCISMLARSVGQALTKHMHELLELMFAFGLSDSLRAALVDLAHHIPPLLTIIQERLLDQLSLVLSGESFRPAGAPPTWLTNSKPKTNGVAYDAVTLNAVEQRDKSTITLALKTLGSFNFTDHVLNEFIKDVVIQYTEDDSAEVRLAAAVTCAQVLARDPVVGQTATHAVKLVSEVLTKLLTVAIADPDPNIRQNTLLSLDPKFDRHLAQPTNIRQVFIALNDEVYLIREVSIKIIGRLSKRNPAYIMPNLRKALIQLLTDMEYSTDTTRKEESANLLAHLVGASRSLTKPYVAPMLKVLLPKSRDPNSAVSSAVMLALGELARTGGEDVAAERNTIMELLMDTLRDLSSPGKREAALRTLGQLCSNTGYVIEPYQDHPGLLGIITSILKTEQAPHILREAVRVLGVLGALDPYRFTIGSKAATEAPPKAPNPTDPSSHEQISSSHEYYYPSVAFAALLGILNDSSSSHHHAHVIEAIMYIFRSLRLKCVPFLKEIIPAFLGAMRICSPNLHPFYFQNLGQLIAMVNKHVRIHVPQILELVIEFWNAGVMLKTTIVDLIEAIALALDVEFRTYLPLLLPLLLEAFEGDYNDRRQTIISHILRAFQAFGSNLEDYVQLALPVVAATAEKADAPVPIRRAALVTMGTLCRKINLTDQSSRIVQPIIRVLNTGPPELRNPAVDTICALMTQIGPDFAMYFPSLRKCFIRNRIQHAQYESMVAKLLRGENLPDPSLTDPPPAEEVVAADAGQNKLQVNQQNLKSAWETAERPKGDDWREWMKRLSVQLLKSSPSHCLRACANLAEVYHPLARDLFNAAFISCWTELYDQYQDELVKAFQAAFLSPTIPPEITQTLLNLAEFMEHDNKNLPIHIRDLGRYATKCHAYAKALHYMEVEAQQEPTAETLEALITINQQLQQRDSAQGVLTLAQAKYGMDIREEWYERLERWDDALQSYERRSEEDPEAVEPMLGRMRCLHALGEWESLAGLAAIHWDRVPSETKRKMAPLAAAAAWGLAQWETMDTYINVLKSDTADKAWFRAILLIHRGQHSAAQRFINKTRDTLLAELTALLGESYSRAYGQVTRVQMLSELEEIITYKECKEDDPSKRAQIQRTWMKRLRGCQREVEVWQRILKVRALVITPRENIQMWIKFAGLCRKSKRYGLADKTLNSLFDESATDAVMGIDRKGPPLVIYAHIKYMWATGFQEDSLLFLREFTGRLRADLETLHNQNFTEPGQTEQFLEYTRLLSRCYYKSSEWQSALQDDWSTDAVREIVTNYHQATNYDPNWYKAWHAWAMANSKVASQYERLQDGDPVPPHIIGSHLVPAIQAYVQSIALSPANALQDTLRLLTIWFKYGDDQRISDAVHEGHSRVVVDTWLDVVPQLIARINHPSTNVRRLIQIILCDVGRAHPQALVYPLTVASKYPSAPRRRAATEILTKLQDHSSSLVKQAMTVSQELVRAAILWPELWNEGLEEASRLFYGDHNIQAMFDTLEPLHELLERGPQTIREVGFVNSYGNELMEAKERCRQYRLRGDISDLNEAWQLYYGVFRRILKWLQATHMLDLKTVSPILLASEDMDLAVPGTYRVGKPIIRIKKFAPTCKIMNSKQRPRECVISGSDGRDYRFLLKGHEDIRQDERVMQLFGLCNTLLQKDSETFKRHLNIRRYSVIPLAPESGLLAWLENCDTLHVVIQTYRTSRKILLNIEARLMQQMAAEHGLLTMIQKVEVFEFAMDNTTGQDLYRALWLKSRNSEAWLDRRVNYSRSLAVMSMVGHILGLGDRHPSNLMLDRVTGMIIHIDFGDCFEIAMTRDKWPERVPFRLTRMLVQAMEISGVEGTFRITAENTMRILRENKESIMAVLEAFVHDPLINWRLVRGGRQVDEREGGATTGDEHRESGPRMRRPKETETNMEDEAQAEVLNGRAMQVVARVEQKLTGRDFKNTESLNIQDQVNRLIFQAVSAENLAQCFTGWCPFW